MRGVGDKVQITSKAWLNFLRTEDPQADTRLAPGSRTIVSIRQHEDGHPVFMLNFPHHWWREEDLMPAEPTDKEKLESAVEVWQKHAEACPSPENEQLVSWLSQLLMLKHPEPLAKEGKVASLDEHRIRVDKEFEHDLVAYLEVTWGKETFAFNAACRDLELMRRGKDDGTLRSPETEWEAAQMIFNVRSLANDLARFWNQDHLVRPGDDNPEGGQSRCGGPG
jgi:hypothetical protein